MKGTPLGTVGRLSPYREKLIALGYDSVEQFVGAAFAAPNELRDYLKLDIGNLLNSLAPGYGSLIAAAKAHSVRAKKFPLGARLRRSNTRRLAVATPFIEATLPPSINWIEQMPPIKDQGHRGTCVAFASLAVVEHYTSLQGSYRDLSEQFLYWDCKANDGDPNAEGTWLSVSFPRLQSDGDCLNSTWEYNPDPIVGNEGEGPPPAGSNAEASSYKVATINPLVSTSVQQIKQELARDRCVAFTIPVFNSWYKNGQVTLTGKIILPLPGEEDVGGHALCMVGYKDDDTIPALGGGYFLIRNSWNSDWGTQCEYGIGYGTIPYAYIASYSEEAYSIY